MSLALDTPRNPKLELFGYEIQWHLHVIYWCLALSLRSTKLDGSPLGQCFFNCGPRPPATGIPGVLAKMQISGLQLRLVQNLWG